MAAVEPIRVEGLKELQRAMRQAQDGSQKQLRVVLNSVAGIVVADAQSRVPTRSGRARATYRAQSGQREARVVAGSARAPYVGWLEWGGRVGKKNRVVRARVSVSRYMGRAFKSNLPRIVERLEDALVDVARSAGLDVKKGT